jgi:hypothetical protein
MCLDLSKFLNQIFEDINLYKSITEINSSKNKKVKTVFTKNKYGNKSTMLFIENK